MRTRLSFLLFSLLTLSAAAVSADERILLIPALGTDSLRSTAGVRAADAVRAALTSTGSEVTIASDEVSRVIRECPDVTPCLNQILVAEGHERGVLVAVWARSGETTPYEVSVTFVDTHESHYAGRARVEGDDLGGAANRALALALQEQSGAGMVALRVQGSPMGATVVIDGQSAGTMPVEVRLPVGEHRVTVAQTGFVTARRTIELTGPDELRFDLPRGVDPEPETSGGVVRPWPALVLAGAGAVALATTLGVTLAGAGCDDAMATCHDIAVGPFATYLVLSSAALIGGITWYLVGGHESETAVSLSPSRIDFRTRF